MSKIIIKPITTEDIPKWLALSQEYDIYVKELVSDITQWYDGNEKDIAFTDYMMAKVSKNEAYMVFGIYNNNCLGAVAFSRKHNRITFFGISHIEEFDMVGEMLLNFVLNQLDSKIDISINVIKSKTTHINKERALLEVYGFTVIGSELENGVPVDKLIKRSC